MKLKGSCHCRAVTFEVESDTYYPYQRCYCSICRKTQGGGGWAINLGARADTLKVKGKKNISVYRARVKNPEDQRAHRSSGERSFCSLCSSNLWLYDPSWPELIHPVASAIDTPLPVPPIHTHLMLEFKPEWVELQTSWKDLYFDRYPEESLADWHARVLKK